MPSSKDIRRFSDKWLEVFEWFEDHPNDTYTVNTDNPKRAKSLRFEFYRARSALQDEPELKKAYTNLDRREVIIDGSKVLFRCKETTPLAELLDRSLKEAEQKESEHGN